MGLGANILTSIKAQINPRNYIEAAKQFPNALKSNAADLATKVRNRDILGALGAGTALALDVGLPLHGMVSAVLPDRIDLDTAGPFEEMAVRGFDVIKNMGYTGAGFKTMMPAGLGAGIISSMLVDSPVSSLVKGSGRLVDKVLSLRPEVSEVKSRFVNRVSDRFKELQKLRPDLSQDVLVNQAAQDIMTQANDYMDYFK